MKKTIRIIPLLLLTVFFAISLSSCSSDTDPADTDFFLGKYKGSISYIEGDKSISTDEGSVTVSKIGDTYSFLFSDGIPDITGVKFSKKDGNTYVSIGTEFTGITITASNLHMLVSKDGKTWTANCSR